MPIKAQHARVYGKTQYSRQRTGTENAQISWTEGGDVSRKRNRIRTDVGANRRHKKRKSGEKPDSIMIRLQKAPSFRTHRTARLSKFAVRVAGSQAATP